MEVVYAACDIGDTQKLTHLLQENEVESVFHFAGNKYVSLCEKNPEMCFKINTEGTQSILEAMKYAKVPHIVFASTYVVYTLNEDSMLLSEESPIHSDTVYGKSKLEAEALIHKSVASGDLIRWHILRYSNVIGSFSGQHTRNTRNFLDLVLEKARTGEAVSLFGGEYHTQDGSVARDFIALQDVVSAHAALLEAGESGIYNVSSGNATTLRELVGFVEDATGINIAIEIRPPQRSEPSSITVSSQKLQRAVAWIPSSSIVQTVKELVG